MTCDDNSYMAPLHLAGRLIMENGGETYRVEETITRMGHAFGFTEVESFAVPSGIFISYRKHDGSIETAVKRVRRRGTDLTRVDAVNAVSRRMEAEQLSCEEVMALLREIEERPAKITKKGLTLAVGLSSFGWAAMFGGGMVDCAVAFAVALLVQSLAFALDKAGMRSFVSTLVGSFLSTVLPMFLQLATGLLNVDATVAACLMPMLPGLAMTNAVQDTLRGDMVSGISSATNALLAAAMIAGGALVGTTLFRLLTGGVVL
ncbi:MAG: threonine/serine exporter family protein [Clostridiales bacterium]|nr:threonine/serine exporter family protein [Clostridiales bacterium]